MDVVGHDDEGVELNPILASLFFKDTFTKRVAFCST